MCRALGDENLDGDYGQDDEEHVDEDSFLKQLEKDWTGTTFKPDVPKASSVQKIRREKADSEQRELRASGSRPSVQAEGLEGQGEELAFALDRTTLVVGPRRAEEDPVDKNGGRLSRFMVAAACDESMSVARQPAFVEKH